ncbi:DUF6264 family protein [Curtobacterium sp. MCBD17_008]|uniref:DUF6264 family protein n=1 Tax=Curtobacterium sp. MCBD17_008 TaxID=2175656 RepID=UPI000DA91050|nr:DUF6264 family protein [Curtobacterium sp. MCBD17_008]PZE95309.1 hypothetical protein DEI95_02840 [Curtobacterium sp. MCBD17_008]
MSAPDGRPTGWDVVPPRGTTAVDAQEARIAPDTAGAATQTPGAVPAGRPAPQYGEYAPEGWVNPVLVEQERQERQEREDRERAAASAAPGAAGGSGRPAVRARAAATADRTATTGDTASARRLGASPVDVLLTFVLLGMGLVSVVQSLSIGSVASTVREELETNYTALQDPGALNGAAMISSVVMLVVFALVLWWSVVRLRAGRRSFWVPLLGGAVATLLSAVVFAAVVFRDDGFVAAMMRQAAGG